MAKKKIMSLATSPSLLWTDKCPCFSCTYGYDDRCERMQQSIPCTYIENWVLGLHSSGTNKKVKMYVTAKKPESRWKLHSRHYKLERKGW